MSSNIAYSIHIWYSPYKEIGPLQLFFPAKSAALNSMDCFHSFNRAGVTASLGHEPCRATMNHALSTKVLGTSYRLESEPGPKGSS